MSYWSHDLIDDAYRACWDEPDDGVAHCASMILPAIEPWLTADAKVLDFGCGVGRLLVPFSTLHPEVEWYGVDTNDQMAAHAHAHLAAHDLPTRVYVRVPRLWVYDAAYSVVVLQHLRSTEKCEALQTVCGVLRPGGVFRFQFVHDGDTGPQSYPTPRETMEGWLLLNGMTDIVFGDDSRFPTWTWCTAVKR